MYDSLILFSCEFDNLVEMPRTNVACSERASGLFAVVLLQSTSKYKMQRASPSVFEVYLGTVSTWRVPEIPVLEPLYRVSR